MRFIAYYYAPAGDLWNQYDAKNWVCRAGLVSVVLELASQYILLLPQPFAKLI
jgi:hypothetical protein